MGNTSYLRVLASEEIASQFPVLWPGLWVGALYRVSLNAAFTLGQPESSRKITMNYEPLCGLLVFSLFAMVDCESQVKK